MGREKRMRCPGRASGGQVTRTRCPAAMRAKDRPGRTPLGTSTSNTSRVSRGGGGVGVGSGRRVRSVAINEAGGVN